MKFNLFFAILTGIFIGIFIKTVAFDIVHVSGESMEPSIHAESKISINKLSYGLQLPFSSQLLIQWSKPKKGDIILYKYNNKTVIKRCVAIEGQALDYSSNSGYIIVEGQPIPLSEQQFQRIKYDTVVPEDTILAIGDNYAHSVDSRDYGFIPVKNILGKVIQR